MVGCPSLLGGEHQRVIPADGTQGIRGFSGRTGPFKTWVRVQTRAAKTGQDHIIIDMQQSLFVEEPGRVISGRTPPRGGKDFFLFDVGLEFSRVFADGTAGHAVADQSQALIFAHDIKCVQFPRSRLIGGREDVAEIIRIKMKSQRLLFEIGDAVDPLGLFPCPGQRGQQHARQNRDNGDDDQQFDQSETPKCRALIS